LRGCGWCFSLLSYLDLACSHTLLRLAHSRPQPAALTHNLLVHVHVLCCLQIR
jgi:hypothetical protein